MIRDIKPANVLVVRPPSVAISKEAPERSLVRLSSTASYVPPDGGGAAAGRATPEGLAEGDVEAGTGYHPGGAATFPGGQGGSASYRAVLMDFGSAVPRLALPATRRDALALQVPLMVQV